MENQLSVAKFGFRNGTIVLIPTTAHEKQLSPLGLSVQTVLHQALDSYPMLGIGIRTEPGLCSIFFSGKTSIVCCLELFDALNIYLGATTYSVLWRSLNSQIVDESKFCLSVPLEVQNLINSYVLACMTCLGIFNWLSHIWA